MQNLISNFSGLEMSRIEMKKVKGGACHVWHLGSSGAYNVASDQLSMSDAKALAAELVRNHGAGYGWCCDSGC